MAEKTAPKSKINFSEESLRLLFEKCPFPVWMFSRSLAKVFFATHLPFASRREAKPMWRVVPGEVTEKTLSFKCFPQETLCSLWLMLSLMQEIK